MDKKYNPETNSNQIFDKTVTQISNRLKKIDTGRKEN